MMQSQALEPRVATLEAAQNETTQTLRWVVAKLGRVCAVQDEHTLRFERMEARLGGVEKGLTEVRTDLASLRNDLPGMMADVMREVLKDTSKP
jgi:hypothetical protein